MTDLKNSPIVYIIKDRRHLVNQVERFEDAGVKVVARFKEFIGESKARFIPKYDWTERKELILERMRAQAKLDLIYNISKTGQIVQFTTGA